MAKNGVCEVNHKTMLLTCCQRRYIFPLRLLVPAPRDILQTDKPCFGNKSSCWCLNQTAVSNKVNLIDKYYTLYK